MCPLSFLPPFSLSFRGPSSATHSPVWKGRRGGGGGGGGGTHSGSPRKSVSFLHLALGRFWRRRRRPRSKAGQGGFWAVSSAFPLIYSSFFIHTHSARGVRGKRKREQVSHSVRFEALLNGPKKTSRTWYESPLNLSAFIFHDGLRISWRHKVFYLCFLKNPSPPSLRNDLLTVAKKNRREGGGGFGYSKFDYRLLPL